MARRWSLVSDGVSLVEMAKRHASPRVPGSRRARSRSASRTPAPRRRAGVTVEEVKELDALRRELERTAGSPYRWNADPADAQRSLAQLVLTLVEFLRRLLERQAIRRFEAGTLTDQEAEDVGRALMELEDTVREMAGRFGLDPDDLNLDLGPVGTLL